MSRLGQIEHVIAAVDLSEPAKVAARVALRIAAASDASMSLVHVEAPFGASYPGSAALIPREVLDRVQSSAVEISEQRLDELRAQLGEHGDEGRIQSVALVGTPTEALGNYALANNADLIVIGGRGKSTVRAWLLGSVARKLSTESPVPLLIVRRGDEQHFDGTYHRIIVGVDYSPFSRPLVEAAAGLLARGGLLELVHVASAPSAAVAGGDAAFENAIEEANQSVLEAESERLRRFSEQLELGQPHVALDVEIGGAADLLLEHARNMNADLIAVGAHRRERISEKLLGTVADRVLHHSGIPVLLLPGPAASRA